MKLDDESRTRIFADITVTIDPVGSTVELDVDGDWYDAEWTGSALHRPALGALPERWIQRARTVDYFAGPTVGVSAGAATVLADGRHATQVRVSKNGDVIVGHATVIDVGP